MVQSALQSSRLRVAVLWRHEVRYAQRTVRGAVCVRIARDLPWDVLLLPSASSGDAARTRWRVPYCCLARWRCAWPAGMRRRPSACPRLAGSCWARRYQASCPSSSRPRKRCGCKCRACATHCGRAPRARTCRNLVAPGCSAAHAAHHTCLSRPRARQCACWSDGSSCSARAAVCSSECLAFN